MFWRCRLLEQSYKASQLRCLNCPLAGSTLHGGCLRYSVVRLLWSAQFTVIEVVPQRCRFVKDKNQLVWPLVRIKSKGAGQLHDLDMSVLGFQPTVGRIQTFEPLDLPYQFCLLSP